MAIDGSVGPRSLVTSAWLVPPLVVGLFLGDRLLPPVDLVLPRIGASITNYGGIVVSLKVKDGAGQFRDVVLGFDNLDGYLKGHPYFGALIGRYGNRISGGRFSGSTALASTVNYGTSDGTAILSMYYDVTERVSTEAQLRRFQRIRERTRRVVALIPPERLEWAPREGAWTFGDLVRHLAAIERWMFAENVHGRPSRYPGHGRELADGHAAVLAYFDRMHDEAMERFRALTPQALQARCTTPGGATTTPSPSTQRDAWPGSTSRSAHSARAAASTTLERARWCRRSCQPHSSTAPHTSTST